MEGSIPAEVIEEVRVRSDIVTVVGEYVLLQKRGKNYLGLCPFHREDTPSFTVTPERQLFYCFGCGLGGNVFTFLMKLLGLTFPEAVRRLAERVGVEIPAAAGETAGEYREKKRLFDLTELAARFYQGILKNHPAAAPARAYLERRGVNGAMVDRFRLGYAPEGPAALHKYLREKGFTEVEVERAGLASRWEGRGAIDRFRKRLLFPIQDGQGRVISFGGRVLDNSQPKYLNGPETPLFRKGENLYALHLAVPSLKNAGRGVLMEGYMDVLAAHQHGVENAVASLGTSLTAKQARLLKRHAREVFIAYDADTAGRAATLRSLDILQGEGLRVRVVRLPAGDDPDAFLHRYGAAAWAGLLEKAPGLIEYKLERLMEGKPFGGVAEKVDMVRALRADLNRIDSPLERDAYVKLVAHRLGLPEEAIRAELAGGFSWQKAAKLQDKTNYPRHTIPGLPAGRNKVEEQLLAWMLADPAVADRVKRELGGEIFQNPAARQVAETLFKGQNPAGLQSGLENGAIALLAELTVREAVTPGARELEALLRRMRLRLLEDRVREKQKALRQAELSGDLPKSLLAELAESQKQIQQLKAEQ